jgi:hypothetical protein
MERLTRDQGEALMRAAGVLWGVEMVVGNDVSLAADVGDETSTCSAHLRVRTALDESRLSAKQAARLIGPAAPGERLGEGWLLPRPVRHVVTRWTDLYAAVDKNCPPPPLIAFSERAR